MRLPLVLSVVMLASSSVLIGACKGASAPAPLVTGQYGIDAIASDDSFVYWTVNTGALRRIAVDGGKLETLATGAPGPTSLAMDANAVYWAAGDGTISRVAKKDGSSTTLAQPGKVLSLAVDDTNAYFSDGDRVLSVPKDQAGATSAIVASGETNAHDLRTSTLAGKLFWVRDADSTIREESVQGGAPTTLVAGDPQSGSPHSVALTPAHIVWTEVVAPAPSGGQATTARVRATTYDGAAPIDLADIDASESLEAVAADDLNAYFTTDAGIVRVVPLTGSAEPQIVISGPKGAVKVATDTYSVYTANPTDGAIFAFSK